MYRSIDLFAGIGGIRRGFDNAFGEHHNPILYFDGSVRIILPGNNVLSNDRNL